MQETIINSLLRATTVTGHQGHTVEAIPIDRVIEISFPPLPLCQMGTPANVITVAPTTAPTIPGPTRIKVTSTRWKVSIGAGIGDGGRGVGGEGFGRGGLG